jgi:thymidylate kinase
MSTFVFALGRPGSGKSLAVRYMIECMHNQRWETQRIKDYEILYHMFQSGDTRFAPAAHDGFDVVDFRVLDEVLFSVQTQATVLEDKFFRKEALITIEFARDNYHHAFQQFNQDFLKRSYFLFVDAELKTCIERIHERIRNPTRLDNHFVSDNILKEYYSKDNLPYMRDKFAIDFGIDPQRVRTIENNGSQAQFIDEVDSFLQEITHVPVLA